MAGRPRVITLEEHYWDAEIMANYGGDARQIQLRDRLLDLDALRLREMDAAGIDFQVISHAPPGAQRLNVETSVELATRANDRLREAIDVHPDRFAGFATLPVLDPAAAAEELERSVTQLGFKGGMIHGMTEGRFCDTPEFWPIYERAAALDVPIYLHPAAPDPGVVATYYGDYVKTYPAIVTAGWGYTVETATMAIRLVLSGVFEAVPDLKVILGHMGESVPFSLGRISEALTRSGNSAIDFRQLFCDHFYITTSANFSTPALLCSILEMGVDRIMFSVDWPFMDNEPGMRWMETVPLSAEDKEKIFSGNARRLLKLS